MAWTRDQMAEARAARSCEDGFYVNLGIGIPTLVANYIPKGIEVTLESENGMLGMGPFPYRGRGGPRPHQRRQADDHRAAEDQLLLLGGQLRDDPRRPHRPLDPGGDAGGGERRPRQLDDPRQDGQRHGRRHGPRGRRPRVIVVMEHTAKDGEHKLLQRCTLPLTGAGVVDIVITELGVFRIQRKWGGTFTAIEIAPGVTIEEIQAKTGAPVESAEAQAKAA